jgi:hypothetical protein
MYIHSERSQDWLLHHKAIEIPHFKFRSNITEMFHDINKPSSNFLLISLRSFNEIVRCNKGQEVRSTEPGLGGGG